MGEETTTKTARGDDLLPLLPVDFCTQILVCLPVKSLLRFKSVCKSWHQLIQTSFFIDLHTTTCNSSSSSSSSSKFGTFVLQTIEPSYSSIYRDQTKLYMLSSGDGEDDYGEEEDDDQKKMVFKVDDLGFLPFYKDYQLHDTLRMVGSCNGIICLHDKEVMDDDRGCRRQYYSNLRNVYLWNPATRQFRILPKSIPVEEGQYGIADIQDDEALCEEFVGFGFDFKTKDYKVLKITSFILDVDVDVEVEGCMCRVQVYSLSTDSWRLLDGIDSLPLVPKQEPFRNHGIYRNGSYYFLGRKSIRRESDSMLLSFDFTKEIFTTMQLPDNRHRLVLSCMGGKLAVFTMEIDDVYEYYDIWVLNEQHGSVVVNKESWIKLHSFQIESRRYPHYTIEPKCISNNGKFAIIDDDVGWKNNKLQLFNLTTKETKTDFLIGNQVCRADVHKKSLVSIMGLKTVDDCASDGRGTRYGGWLCH